MDFENYQHNSLTTKIADDKLIISANFQKMLSKSVDLDEVAHYEPPHQDLHCLQI